MKRPRDIVEEMDAVQYVWENVSGQDAVTAKRDLD